MTLGHVRAAGAGLVVHAWGSPGGLCATTVGAVDDAGVREGARPVPDVEIGAPDDALRALAAALEAYLAGGRLEWDGPLDLRAVTPFQRAVYAAVRAIPHGELRRYADVAEAIGRPGAVRAVGSALGRNPWPVVVPCHRVVAGADLGGYACGAAAKRTLLALEAGQRALPWEAGS